MFVDTSFCIDLMRERRRGREGPASLKSREIGNVPLYMSLFVACELQAGAHVSGRPEEELQRVQRLSEWIEIVLPGRELAVAYGEAEAALRARGKPIPIMDLLIGVMAKMHGMSLIARRESHFRLIPGLVLEEY